VKLDSGSASIIAVEDFLNGLGDQANDGSASVVEVVLEAPDFSIVLRSELHRFGHTTHAKGGTRWLAGKCNGRSLGSGLACNCIRVDEAEDGVHGGDLNVRFDAAPDLNSVGIVVLSIAVLLDAICGERRRFD